MLKRPPIKENMTVNDWREFHQARREIGRQRLAEALEIGMPEGFRAIEGLHHWQGEVAGDILDYFPNAGRWRYRGKFIFGTRRELDNFIRRRMTAKILAPDPVG